MGNCDNWLNATLSRDAGQTWEPILDLRNWQTTFYAQLPNVTCNSRIRLFCSVRP